MGLPSGVNVWIPNVGFQRKKTWKPTANLILWGFVQDVLHGVAHDMVSLAGAVYVNTDGYIIPDERMKDAAKVFDSWGLHATIKEWGRAVVRGAGDYDIGGKRSRVLRTVPRSHRYIEPREIDWLRRKVKFFSHRINLDFKETDVRIFV
jgi:hypothetical protein